MKEIHILCGLPGSGKSHYANEKLMFFGEKNTKVYAVDEWMLQKKRVEDLLLQVKDAYRTDTQHLFILDGLFLTHDDYERLLDIFSSETIVFHYWIPNREICLFNDQGRREKNARITILHAPCEEPNIETLKKKNPQVTLVRHEIIRKDEAK